MNDPNFCVSNLENRATLKIVTSLKIISESKETENKIEKENQHKREHFYETFNETEEPLTWLLMKRGKS